MANLSGYYDPNDKPESFEVLPAGTYTVKIAASDWKATKSGNGKYLQFEMVVCDGEYKDRKVYDRFNLDNPSKEAVRIARGQFASLREAVGIPRCCLQGRKRLRARNAHYHPARYRRSGRIPPPQSV